MWKRSKPGNCTGRVQLSTDLDGGSKPALISKRMTMKENHGEEKTEGGCLSKRRWYLMWPHKKPNYMYNVHIYVLYALDF